MKLHRRLLERIIELPEQSVVELRQLLDDVGLEVKSVDGEGEGAIFTIETLANRGDTISALGCARELSARLLSSIKFPPLVSELEDRRISTTVRKTTDKCLRYALLEMTLPKQLQLRSEITSVVGERKEGRAPIVDILNYIQLELGQPMHAFDRAKVEGEVTVAELEKAEEIEALDGARYLVPAGAVVIRDRKKVIAVAGVIGCANSMVDHGTTRVLVESACFDPVAVRLARRAMGISTDASHLFERGSDSELVLPALRRLVYLVGAAGGSVKDAEAAHVVGFNTVDGGATERRKLTVSLATIRKELNLPRLQEAEILGRLKCLGFSVESGTEAHHFVVTVPSWRLWDIRNPEDIVEEVARAYGYNRVKLELPALQYELPEPGLTEQFLERVEPVLHGSGFLEVITQGFTSALDPKLIGDLDEKRASEYIPLKNAVDSSYSHMKVTNLLHLARLCETNRRFGVESIKVYEFGRLFGATPLEGRWYEHERDTLTLAVSGRWVNSQWRKAEPLETLLAATKGTVESLFRALGVPLSVIAGSDPLLHPGMQAVLKTGKQTVGCLGVIHPLLQERLDLAEPMVYVELDVEPLAKLIEEIRYPKVSLFPSVWRDITVRLPARGSAGDVVRWIHDTKASDLAKVDIVDDFKRTEEDFRRVSYRLLFQSLERTLESAEVDATVHAVLAHLKDRHGIELAS